MIYKIILGKAEITIDEEDKNKVANNIDKNFIVLKSGEIVNPSFIQGIVLDHEASRQEKKYVSSNEHLKELNAPRENGDVSELIKKYKPEFMKVDKEV